MSYYPYWNQMRMGYPQTSGSPFFYQQNGVSPPRPNRLSHSDYELMPPPLPISGPSVYLESGQSLREGTYTSVEPQTLQGSLPDYASSGGGGSAAFANDCEIVVLNKSQQEYGEMIERELRKNGLRVDIMFPKGGVNVFEFLKPFSKLGTIFAVVVDVDNEQHRTVNFYQFFGLKTPQYHKNVPLNMAYGIITTKYEQLKQNEIGTVPDSMKSLLERLLREETLQDVEYISLVGFIQERRVRQKAFLNRTSSVQHVPKTTVQSLVDTPEGKELKTRILSMINEDAP